MQRDASSLADNRFDLLIVGGGIHGAALAWCASLAGFSTALIDRGDFGGDTSANSQKIIHGGLRYLQNLDFGRARSSAEERRRLLWLAPHLVYPQRSILPISGHGSKGREAVWLGLHLYNLLTIDLQLPDAAKRIPAARLLTKAELAALVPEMSPGRFLGAAQWHDAMCWNTERLVLAFAKGASRLGASVANYVEALSLLKEEGHVIGVTARDQLGSEAFDIRAVRTVDCTGPWLRTWWGQAGLAESPGPGSFVSGINLVTERIFEPDVTVSLRTQSEGQDGVLVVSPWGGLSILGTDWMEFPGGSIGGMVGEDRCCRLLETFNATTAGRDLSLADVRFVHHGLVPAEASPHRKPGRNWLTRTEIRDHQADGCRNLYSVRGVKYTTAAAVAEGVLKKIFPGYQARPLVEQPRLPGGDIDDWGSFVEKGRRLWRERELSGDPTIALRDYGSEIDGVLDLARDFPAVGPGEKVALSRDKGLVGKILFAIRHEMARTLSDVVLRRTGMGSSGFPGVDSLRVVAGLMTEELNWSPGRAEREVREVEGAYPSFLRGTE